VLRLAGAVEHGSSHLLARTLVEAAVAAGPLPEARHVVEAPGRGVSGQVGKRDVAVGSWSYIVDRYPAAAADFGGVAPDGAGLRAYVAVEGRGAAMVEYADALRPGLAEFFERLRRLGVRRTVLLSGDAQPNADAVARAVGIDQALGDLLPEEKVAAVQALLKRGERVLMVGDGTNDAPALSSATVGIALAAGGGGITAEAADAVILADDPTRIVEAITISRRTMRIARQSIWVGLGLSAVAMAFAAAGVIPPTIGAVLQEVVDVAVILNALRASQTPTPTDS
jgi:P-type E1-E2 ATPase